MAKVPQIQPQVPGAQLPGTPSGPRIEPEDVGAGLGKSLREAGQAVSKIAADARVDARRRLSTEVGNDVRDAMAQSEEQFTDLKRKDALQGYAEYKKRFDEWQKNALERFDDPDDKEAFLQQQLRPLRRQYNSVIENHNDGERNAHEQGNHQTVLVDAHDAVRRHSGDRDLIEDSISSVQVEIALYDGDRGASNEQMDDKFEKQHQSLWRSAIDAEIRKGNFDNAESYLDKRIRKLLDPATVEDFDKRIETGLAGEDNQGIIDMFSDREGLPFADMAMMADIEPGVLDDIRQDFEGKQRETLEQMWRARMAESRRLLTNRMNADQNQRLRTIDSLAVRDAEGQFAPKAQEQALAIANNITNAAQFDQAMNRYLRRFTTEIKVNNPNTIATARGLEQINDGKLKTIDAIENYSDTHKLAPSQTRSMTQKLAMRDKLEGLGASTSEMKGVVNAFWGDKNKWNDLVKVPGAIRKLMDIVDDKIQSLPKPRKLTAGELEDVIAPWMLVDTDGKNRTLLEKNVLGIELSPDEFNVPEEWSDRYRKENPGSSDAAIGEAYLNDLNTRATIAGQDVEDVRALDNANQAVRALLPGPLSEQKSATLLGDPEVKGVADGTVHVSSIPPSRRFDVSQKASELNALRETSGTARKRRATYAGVPTQLQDTFERGKFWVDESAEAWREKFPTRDRLEDSEEARRLEIIRGAWLEALEQYIDWKFETDPSAQRIQEQDENKPSFDLGNWVLQQTEFLK